MVAATDRPDCRVMRRLPAISCIAAISSMLVHFAYIAVFFQEHIHPYASTIDTHENYPVRVSHHVQVLLSAD